MLDLDKLKGCCSPSVEEDFNDFLLAHYKMMMNFMGKRKPDVNELTYFKRFLSSFEIHFDFKDYDE